MAQIHAYIHACMHTWIHNILLKYMHTCHVHPYIEACIHGCMHCLNTCRHGWNACIQTYIAKIRAYSIEMHVRACTISQGSPSCQVMTDFEVLRVSFFKRGSDYFRFYRFRVPWGKCGNPENGKHDLVFSQKPWERWSQILKNALCMQSNARCTLLSTSIHSHDLFGL